MVDRAGQEGGDDLERGKVVDEYFVKEKRPTRCAPALCGIGGRHLHRYGQRDVSMDSGWHTGGQ